MLEYTHHCGKKLLLSPWRSGETEQRSHSPAGPRVAGEGARDTHTWRDAVIGSAGDLSWFEEFASVSCEALGRGVTHWLSWGLPFSRDLRYGSGISVARKVAVGEGPAQDLQGTPDLSCPHPHTASATFCWSRFPVPTGDTAPRMMLTHWKHLGPN